MRKPSTKRRRLLEKAVTGYQTHLTIAAPYLAARGLTKEVCEAARLGVVISPEAGHEHVYGRLAIPYMDMQGVYSLRFRCLEQHDCKDVSCPKYLGVQGDETGIYAVEDTDLPAETAHITEGELDRLILKIVFPDDCVVALPGAKSWKPHHQYHFQGFESVLVWGDGDKAGREMAEKIKREVRVAESVAMPAGHDVNSLYLEKGIDAIRKLAGEADDEAADI
jgi:hypothetical protein